MPNQKIGAFLSLVILISCVVGSSITEFTRDLSVIGSISSISILVTSLFAFGLVYIYSELGKLDPQVGGLVGHITKFSPKYGSHVCMFYFHGTWLSNLIIAINALHFIAPMWHFLYSPIYSNLFLIAEIWFVCGVFYFGLRLIVWFIIFGLIFQLLPFIFLLSLGWSKFSFHLFSLNWNVTGHTDVKAILMGISLCIWYFIGFESSSINAGLMAEPRKNISYSSIIGFTIIVVLYTSVNILTSGLLFNKTTMHLDLPILSLLKLFFPSNLVELYKFFIFFASVASLMSWMLILTQVARRGGKSGFLPKFCGELNKHQFPIKSTIYMSFFMTIILVLLMFCPQEFLAELLDYISKVTILLVSIAYIYLSCYFLVMSRTIFHRIVGTLSLLFCIMGIIFTSFESFIVVVLIFIVTTIKPKSNV